MNEKDEVKPLKIKLHSIRDVIAQGKTNYPKNKSLRHQWIRKTLALLKEGKHILYYNREEMWKIKVLK